MTVVAFVNDVDAETRVESAHAGFVTALSKNVAAHGPKESAHAIFMTDRAEVVSPHGPIESAHVPFVTAHERSCSTRTPPSAAHRCWAGARVSRTPSPTAACGIVTGVSFGVRMMVGRRTAVGGTIATERTTADRELVLLARKGDEGDASFRVLYERHGPEVLAFVAHLVRDGALAEDVLQETFLRAHGALESYDEERSFRAWILGIARNAAIDAIRARLKRERIVEEKAKRPPPPAPAPVPEAERREEAELARAALDALPPESRALLIQRHGLDMKMAELAESLAVTEKTATARLRAALLRFTEALLQARGRS